METFSTYQQNHKHLEEGWKIQTIATPEGHVQFQIVQQQRINKVIIAPTSTTATGARPIMGGNTDIWMVRGNYIIRVQKTTTSKIYTREHSVSSTYRPTWWMETNYSKKTWTRGHDLHWQLPKCGTKGQQRTFSRRSLERRNYVQIKGYSNKSTTSIDNYTKHSISHYS